LNKHIKVEELVIWEDDNQDFSEGELEVIPSRYGPDHILAKFIYWSRSINVGEVSSFDADMLDTLSIPNHKHTLFKYARNKLPKTIAWSFTTT